MTPSEQPPAPDQQPDATFDQRGQAIYGPQTNIAGGVNTGGGIFNAGGTINISSPAAAPPYDVATELVAHAPPEDFVVRATQSDQVRQWLLPPHKAPVALIGPGGFGKTTLVQALCHDPAIRNHFKDGLRWVQLAEEPSDLLSIISDLVVRLGRPRPDFKTLENATTALIDALGDQTILLVIDNVWRATELAPLLKGGPNCVRLLTTRDGSLVPAGANTLELDSMTEVEAVQLLTTNLPDAAGLDAADLARRLYYWPLLLRLINSTLHDRLTHEGLPLADAWQSIRQDLTDFGMTAFDDPKDAAARDRAVRASLNISLNQLSPAERACYGQLAIFPAAAIHWSALSRLWQIDLAQTRALCRKLRTLSLLYLNEATRTIRLHDVFRGYLQNEQAANLVTLHQTFLRSYGLTHWTDLPADEPYLWDHLAYHLIAAERSAELTALFADDSWLQVRVAHDGYTYDGYLADLTQAWQLAHTAVHHAVDTRTGSAQLAACVHYALIRTTINALAANYLPALVARAVATGLWSLDRALSLAYQVSDPEARAKMLTLLLATNCGTAAQRSIAAPRALDAALAIRDVGDLVAALVALVPHLPVNLLDQALQAARALQDQGSRVRVLVALAPYLPGPQRTQVLDYALQATLVIQDERSRVDALVALVPHLPVNLLDQALQAALVIQNEWSRVRVLVALAPYLPGPQRTQVLDYALQAALVIQNEWSHVAALVALVPHLPVNLLDQALQAALAFQDAGSRVRALVALATHLTDPQRTKVLGHALQAALTIQDAGSRVDALVALAPHLTAPQRTQALDHALQAALAIEAQSSRVDALVALVPHLTGNLLDHALQVALVIQNARPRVDALVALVPHLPAPQRTQALDHALRAALAIEAQWSRVDALVALVPHLTGNLLNHALQAALAFQDERSRVRALVALVPHLTDPQRAQVLDHALQAVLAIENEGSRVRTLVALAPCLTGNLLDQALQAALAFQDERSRVRALVALTQHLTAPQRAQVLDHALQAALAIQYEESRVAALVSLAPHLTGNLLDQVLQATLAIQYEESRVAALVALAPHLTAPQRTKALDHALQAVLAIENERSRVDALVALVPHLTGNLLNHALQAALAFQDAGSRVRALVALAPHLTTSQRTEVLDHAFQAAFAIEAQWSRVDALVALVPLLATPQRAQALDHALQAALAIENEWSRVRALVALVPLLATPQRAQALDHALQAVLAIENERFRVAALEALAPHLTANGETHHVLHITLADHLRNYLQIQPRSEVLAFVTKSSFFAPPIVDQPAIAAIAQSLVAICGEWRWL